VDSVLFVVNEVLVIMYKMESDDLYIIAVTPLAGVWIEICYRLLLLVNPASLPLRECGLKLLVLGDSNT